MGIELQPATGYIFAAERLSVGSPGSKNRGVYPCVLLRALARVRRSWTAVPDSHMPHRCRPEESLVIRHVLFPSKAELKLCVLLDTDAL